MPAGHDDHAPHEVAFEVVLNVPAAQLEHTRSLVDVPAVETYVPGAHVVIAVQDVAPAAEYVPAAQTLQLPAFVVEENVPAAHGVHTRSALAPGVFDT